MMELKHYIDYFARGIEVLGVLTMVIWILISLIKYLSTKKYKVAGSYHILRQDFGRGILLGLEILVAGDIIATVATEPTMQSVLILGLIVLIRTFLSFSLEIELNGHFPWQKSKKLNEHKTDSLS